LFGDHSRFGLRASFEKDLRKEDEGMVKRTAVVLGIMSLLLVGGATVALAQCGGGDFGCRPLYVGVKCPPMTTWTTIIKTWEGKVEAPYMPAACGVAAGCGNGLSGRPVGLVGGLVGAIATPLDWLFGGFDGVYGCGFGALGDGCSGGGCECCMGPLPNILAAVPRLLAAPTTFTDVLW